MTYPKRTAPGLAVFFMIVGASGCGTGVPPASTTPSQSSTAPIAIQPATSAPVVETGIVKVEFDIAVDPKSIITIGGNEYTRADLDKEIQLKAGTYTLTVKEAGLALPPRSFSLEKDQRRVIRVFEPNRHAAEWVLGIGGFVQIVGGQGGKVEKLTDLPQTPFTITQLDTRQKPVADEDLENLAGLTGLIHLTVQKAPITDAGLAHLMGLSNLVDLNLDHAKQVSDAGIARLKGLPKLRKLHLVNTAVTDAGVAHLRELDLDLLALGGTQTSDAALEHISSMKNLSALSVGKAVTDAGLEHLKGLNKLIHLNVQGTKVTDNGVQQLKNALPNLKEILR